MPRPLPCPAPKHGVAFGRVVTACAAALLMGCTEVPTPLDDVVSNPRSVALVCVVSGAPVAMKDCPSQSNVRAFVTAGSKGSVAVAVPSEERWIDADPAIPGLTPLMLGGLPQTIVTDDSDPRWLYVTLGVARVLPGGTAPTHSVARIDAVSMKVTFTALPFAPAGLVVAAVPEPTLFIADPQGGRVWSLPATAFENQGGGLTAIEIGGSPHKLAFAPDKAELWVGHLQHNHVTVIDATARKLSARISLGPACDDGLDNDGDGKTDEADPGCDDRLDRHEGDPESGQTLCGDGKDNDGDGLIDALDPSCAPTPTTDPCRDGIDNDGDGKTDYPDDRGCVGFGGLSEARGEPTCGDGVDNDGDGKTDTDDDGCADRSADTEVPGPGAGVQAACGDGVDNDGDGKTDTDDADCPSPTSGGEQRPACDNGLDDDGDGLTDGDDPDCFNRASAAEVSSDRAPISQVVLTPDGKHVLVSHRQRRVLYVLEADTRKLLEPVPGTTAPFARPSALAAREDRLGLTLDLAPLAMAPLTAAGRQGAALTLALGGMVQVRVSDDSGAVSIGLLESSVENQTKAAKPSLVVEGTSIDLGSNAPRRYASFGPLITGVNAKGDKTWYGLTISADEAEHRTEQWRFVYQGQLPGGERHAGRMLRPDLLLDAHADFCRMGVVPGDLLLLHRGAAAPECGGLKGDTLRYRVVEVGPDTLRLDAAGGTVDVAIDSEAQLEEIQAGGVAVPLPPAACVPRSGLHYELRADGWLVVGERSGLLSSRRRQGQACEDWSAAEPLTASRLVQPGLRAPATGEAPMALGACPLTESEVKSALRVTPYGGGAETEVTAFSNPVFSARLLPGCLQPENVGSAPRLLPSIRDMTWTFALTSGFAAQTTAVGASPIALATASGLDRAYVVDQGLGALYVVGIASSVVDGILQ